MGGAGCWASQGCLGLGPCEAPLRPQQREPWNIPEGGLRLGGRRAAPLEITCQDIAEHGGGCLGGGRTPLPGASPVPRQPDHSPALRLHGTLTNGPEADIPEKLLREAEESHAWVGRGWGGGTTGQTLSRLPQVPRLTVIFAGIPEGIL